MPADQDKTVVVHGKLQYLDALRGWAILLVMTTHISMGPYAVRGLDIFQSNWREQAALNLPSVLAKLAWIGNLGVQLFFVVSAFSLTLSSAARRRSCDDQVVAFAIRRFFRIAPAFYLAIVAYTWVYGREPLAATADAIHVRDIVLTALFLHALVLDYSTSVVPGGWSIAEEMTFYCLLPLILSCCTTIRAILLLSFAAFVLSQSVMIVSSSNGVAGSAMYYWFPSQFVVFCLGITVCRVVLTGRAGLLSSIPAPLVRAGAVLTFLAMTVLFPYHIVPASFVQTHIIFAALASLLCVLLHFQPTRLLVNPLTAAIGRVSFSMYLIHFALLAPSFRLAAFLLHPPGNGGTDTGFFLLSLLILIAGSFILSEISYHLIEDPGIRLGAWLIRVRNATRLTANPIPPA